MMEIDYKQIADYYMRIIGKIYSACEAVEEPYWDNEKSAMIYGKAYLDAYSYLQKAEWRLSNVYNLKDYYNREDFQYYGLEQLQEVRHRIQHYLEDETIDLSHLPDCVYEYKEYDDIIITYYNGIRKDDMRYDKWKYYYNLKGYVIRKKHIVSDLEYACERFTGLKRELDSPMYSKFNEIVEDEIKEEIQFLSGRIDKLLGKVKAIDIETLNGGLD